KDGALVDKRPAWFGVGNQAMSVRATDGEAIRRAGEPAEDGGCRVVGQEPHRPVAHQHVGAAGVRRRNRRVRTGLGRFDATPPPPAPPPVWSGAPEKFTG